MSIHTIGFVSLPLLHGHCAEIIWPMLYPARIVLSEEVFVFSTGVGSEKSVNPLILSLFLLRERFTLPKGYLSELLLEKRG